MTETNKDKDVHANIDGMSFKEKILADLAAAKQERQRQYQEWQQVVKAKEHQPQDVNIETEEMSRSVSTNYDDSTFELDQDVAELESFLLNTEPSEEVSKNLDSQVDQQLVGDPEEVRLAHEIENSEAMDTVETEEDINSAVLSSEREISDNIEATKEQPNLRELVQNHDLPSDEELSVWQTQAKESNSKELDYDDIEEVGVKEMSRESRRKTNRLAAKISTVFVSLLVLVILAGGFFTYRYVTSAIAPLDSKDKNYIQVEIPSGSGNKLIGKILEDNGVIKDSTVFNFYTKFKNYSNFQSGYYNFQKSMSLDDIAKYLQEGGTAEPQKPVLGKIAVPEGYTLKQISESVTLNANTEETTDKPPFKAEEFMATVQDESFIAEMVKKYPKLLDSLPEAKDVKYRLEGYLFPATYDYYEGTTIREIVDQMLAAMDSNLSPYYASITNSGMSVNQVLTMASLVEKEGATDDDREMIASVFYNRWNIGMPLQSNIAILYAMDKLGEKTTLAEDAAVDTSINSPYNIYLNTGLMPGPVDSPGMSAILATINPANTKYYYFVADVTTGAVYFAESYEEHSANVEKYVNSKLNN